jgi:hypothetical protein
MSLWAMFFFEIFFCGMHVQYAHFCIYRSMCVDVYRNLTNMFCAHWPMGSFMPQIISFIIKHWQLLLSLHCFMLELILDLNLFTFSS